MFFKLTLTKVTVGSLGVVLGLCCHCSHCFVGTNSAREAKIHRSLCSLSARILSGVLFCWRLYGQVFSSAYIREKHHRHCWPELWYVETAFPGSCSFTRSVRQREFDAVDQGVESRDWNFVHPYRRDYDLQYRSCGEEWRTEISHQWPLSGVCPFKAENLKTPS